MQNQTFTHDMKDLCEQLDQRIAKLDQFRAALQRRIDDKIAVEKNTESLARVSNSLTYAKDARQAMESSCCDFSCNYDLYE